MNKNLGFQNMKNIVYHYRVRGTGAEGVHIAGIINGFRSFSHNVHIVSPSNLDPTIDQDSSIKLSEKKRIFQVKLKILHKLADFLPQPFFEIIEFFYNFYAVFYLMYEVSVNNIDFIYERYAFFNFSGALVSRFKRIPFVVEINELSGLKRVRGQFFVKLCSLIEKFIISQATLVITVSDFLNNEVKKKVECNASKVVTIPNGVPEKWINQKISIEDVDSIRNIHNLTGKKVICFVGGLVHWHNFDLLLKAVKEIQVHFKDTVLVLIGDGPEKKFIKNRANELCFQPGSILFVGNISHSDIPLYLNMANIAIIPETNDFRSPIKMFEYMSMGLPVIAPKKPAIESVITDNVEGLLFEPGNYFSLSDKLIVCLNNPKLNELLGEKARQKVINYFTWERHSASILHLINEKTKK